MLQRDHENRINS